MINNFWNAAINSWHAWLKAGGAREQTLTLRLYQMRRFAQDHVRRSPWSLTADALGAWLSSHDWGLESLRSYRSALRSFYGWAHASGKCQTDPSRLLRKIKPKSPIPRPASESVVDAALDHADPREWLILMLGSRQGLRRGEISCGHSDDLRRDLAGWSLLVHGKGGKERVVPLLDPVADALLRLPAGWFFPNGRETHITAGHVGVLARRVMQRSASTHQLRHRFATVTYSETHDIRAVQELLGHASVATTQIYTAVTAETLRAVVQTAG